MVYYFLTSMVGWAGAPQGAPVPNEAGKTNSVQSTTRKIGLFGGGYVIYSLEAAFMATIPTPVHALLTRPLNPGMDFTVLAEHCALFAEILLENENPAQREAFQARLAYALALLRPTLDQPIPTHLMDSLTVDVLPAESPCFEPEVDLLCEYCQVLVRLLTEKAVASDMETTLTRLLYELVSYFADELRAPRWICTDDGVKIIEEMEVAGENRMP